jgi:hypothetical protein
MSDDPKCKTCDQTLSWHKDNADVVRHDFNPGSLPTSATFGTRRGDGPRQPVLAAQRGSQAPLPWPHDPVLRQALVDKGVITPDDLRNAEAKIMVVTGQFHQAVREAAANGE